MKKIMSISAVLLCAFALSQNVSAAIDPGAPSASHHTEEAAAAIHVYLHDTYGDSFGSHALEQSASALHQVLHAWQHSEASEADVDAQMEALKLDWNNFRQTIFPVGLLNAGDTTLDELYGTLKDMYKELRFLLRKAK